MMFKNRVLQTIFAPKRDEVMQGWRKLHDEELCNLYSLPGIIKMIKSLLVAARGKETTRNT
jgi:hypothetical protein